MYMYMINLDFVYLENITSITY